MNYESNPQLQSSSSLDIKDICNQTEEEIFSQGYHNFLKNKCYLCHVSGPGKGTFAHPDSSIAYPAFKTLGIDKISSMAVNDSHNSPYTGSHNINTINDLKAQWSTFQIEKAKCGIQNPQPTQNTTSTYTPHFLTNKKPIPTITGTPSTININGTVMETISYNTVEVIFELDSELTKLTETPLPITSGAKLSISLTGYSTSTGATGYLIQMPKLIAGTTSLNIKGLHPLINGRPISYAYTFQHINKDVYKQTEVMLSGGSMLALGPLINGDQISLNIESLEIVDIPEPPVPPSLQFELTEATILKTELGKLNPYKVKIKRTGDPSLSVNVNISVNGDESLPAVAKGLTDSSGRNQYDWDYRFVKSPSVTLLPGENEKSFDIIFSDDLRDAPNKTLTLELKNPFGAVLGSKKILILNLPDYNSPTPQEEITFSNLMEKGGILEMNCVRCHNSIDKQGGYDMTDYDQMVAKGVIVPGDLTPNNHKMFRRMNPDSPEAGTITPMPLDGFLTQDLTLFVESWIKSGAKNN